MNAADNYPPGMTSLPPDENPIGKCMHCGVEVFADDCYEDNGDLICNNHLERHLGLLYSHDEQLEIVAKEAGIVKRKADAA